MFSIFPRPPTRVYRWTRYGRLSIVADSASGVARLLVVLIVVSLLALRCIVIAVSSALPGLLLGLLILRCCIYHTFANPAPTSAGHLIHTLSCSSFSRTD
ncbi:hypothetical protein BV20DRAFT_336591 [Pilatotrama ljubarskyi]|nr:hypothetical protein BV20DRAFT_336591 [Pilatotrama ljubarskyi]